MHKKWISSFIAFSSQKVQYLSLLGICRYCSVFVANGKTQHLNWLSNDLLFLGNREDTYSFVWYTNLTFTKVLNKLFRLGRYGLSPFCLFFLCNFIQYNRDRNMCVIICNNIQVFWQWSYFFLNSDIYISRSPHWNCKAIYNGCRPIA